MDPFQFLLFAEALARDARHPAGYRSAISRAYYAAHHCIKEFVESAGIRLSVGAMAHADVWNHLADTGDAEMERVGSDLADLHSNRLDADYRLSNRAVENPRTVGALVKSARELIEVARKCRADQSRFERMSEAFRTRNAFLRTGAR